MWLPKAEFQLPVVFEMNAEKPLAVLPAPVLVKASALAPVPVFWLPVVSNPSTPWPTAVLTLPVAVKLPAPLPTNVSNAPTEQQGWINGPAGHVNHSGARIEGLRKIEAAPEQGVPIDVQGRAGSSGTNAGFARGGYR